MVRAAGAWPVPCRVEEILPPGVPLTCRVAALAPTEVGANFADTSQDVPAVRLVPEQPLLVMTNSAVPAMTAVRVPVLPAPVFLTTKILVVLWSPTTTEPNDWVVGVMDKTPPTHVPALHWGVVPEQSALVQQFALGMQTSPQALWVASHA